MNKEKESKIIKEAMKRIGTKRVNTLDGLTIIIDNVWYNIYVNENIVTVEEI